MTFKPAIWFPVAVGLSLINLAGAAYAAAVAEPLHAGVHVALTLAFGWWALRLRRPVSGGDRHARVDALETEVGDLRRELSETQERLDFAERMLTQSRERTRVER